MTRCLKQILVAAETWVGQRLSCGLCGNSYTGGSAVWIPIFGDPWCSGDGVSGGRERCCRNSFSSSLWRR